MERAGHQDLLEIMTELKAFSGRNPSQMPGELLPFIDFMHARGCRRYLEIGARHGDTFHQIMSTFDAGARGIAVDLAGGLWGTADSKDALLKASDDLIARGLDSHVIFGDSHSRSVIGKCGALGPFDFALIDGDHTYHAVKQDFKDYAPLCAYLAFHDIVGRKQSTRRAGVRFPVEVPRLWAEIKGDYEHWEFVEPGSQMGIGVVKLCNDGVTYLR